MPAAKRPATTRAPRTATPTRPRQIAVLIVGPLLCVMALTGLAFVGLSQQAQRDAQERVSLAALAARGALMANVGDLKLSNGQLTSSLPANVTTLNNNDAEAQRLRGLVGVDTLIAQREQSGLTVVASSLTTGRSNTTPVALGEILSGSVASGACSANGGAGTLTVAGADYLASSAPLIDGSGACVGTLIALTPESALASSSLQYTVILAMAGALLTLLTAAVGLSLYTRGGGAGDPKQAERLQEAVASLSLVEAACAAQMDQRDWVGRRLATGGRRLQRLMATLAHDRIELQDTTSDIWAGMSHPGAPIDPDTAMHLAREGAVVAARLGSRLNDFDTFTDTLLDDLAASHDIDAMLNDTIIRAGEAIAALRVAVGHDHADAPAAQAANPIRRPSAGSDLYSTNKVAAQRRYTTKSPAHTPQSLPRQSGGHRAVRADSSQQRAVRPDSSQHRSMRDWGATGQTPAAGQSQQGRRPSNPGASGVQRHQGLASSSGRNHISNGPQPPRQSPRPDFPTDGRDRGASGSRWLND